MRPFRIVSILALSACATGPRPPASAPRPRAPDTRAPTLGKQACAPGTICPVFWLRETHECPNWYPAHPALHIARIKVGCYGAKPGNRCQEKLMQCHGCDICLILQPNEGPETSLVDSFADPEQRAATHPPGPDNLWMGWRIRFAKSGCTDESKIEVLAGDMIEEAAHACPSVGGGWIYDHNNIFHNPPPGCSGKEIQDECMGR